MIKRKNPRYAKVGIFAVAHATYWGQFEGLYDNIMKYHPCSALSIVQPCALSSISIPSFVISALPIEGATM